MKKYFYTINGEDYESYDPLEVAGKIYEEADKNEELLNKVLLAIVDKMVNEYEEDDQYLTPYEEAFARQFDEAMDKLKDMKLRKFLD